MYKISVIIPTYNRSKFLSEAIASVQQQEYPDFEIIVVDDGSTDNTYSMLNNNDDNRIKIIFQENSGRSSARNHGLQIAKGNLICFLDDDDLYLPGKLSKQAEYLIGHPMVDVVGSGFQYIDENGREIGIKEPWLDSQEMRVKDLLISCPLITSSVMIRKEALEKMDHWFDPNLELAEDKDFFVRLLYTGSKFEWIPMILSGYRIHLNNSQHDWVKYTKAKIQLLDKFFAQSNIHAEISANINKYYFNTYLTGACQCFARGQTSNAIDFLRQSPISDSQISGKILNECSEIIANFARNEVILSGVIYIEQLLDNLPEDFSLLKQQRTKILGLYYMGNLFENSKNSYPISIMDWSKGIFFDPKWLLNKGVWSILFKSQFTRKK